MSFCLMGGSLRSSALESEEAINLGYLGRNTLKHRSGVSYFSVVLKFQASARGMLAMPYCSTTIILSYPVMTTTYAIFTTPMSQLLKYLPPNSLGFTLFVILYRQGKPPYWGPRGLCNSPRSLEAGKSGEASPGRSEPEPRF